MSRRIAFPWDSHRRIQAIASDVRGAVMTEYVVIVGVVSLVAITALIGVVPQLIASFTHARDTLSQDTP